jgi:hypothetical protein
VTARNESNLKLAFLFNVKNVLHRKELQQHDLQFCDSLKHLRRVRDRPAFDMHANQSFVVNVADLRALLIKLYF